ncbi:hypothetical protein Ocin01_08142 [Orchesella cincta]|uniref:Transmembrane protein n=1 Tax=Orchesella cincta TaxID=48709 RepID=A0A1D2MZR7_ORCCI|nr:hypothetical protein Ocin01_08142 [Orchesella cincta]
MLLNPCPCTSLQKGVKVVALFEAVLSLYFVYRSFTLLQALAALDGFDPTLYELARGNRPLIILHLLVYILQVLFAALLFLGAHKNNSGLCWTWFGFLTLVILFRIIYGILITTEVLGTSITTSFHLIEVVIISLVEIYLLYVDYAFIAQLRQQTEEQLLNTELGDSNMVKAGTDPPQDSAAEQPMEPPQLSHLFTVK